MNVLVFDTETTGLTKPYCYNIGYGVYEVETMTQLLAREFVIEQVWHNLELFNTAYYADKRQIYVSAMRGRRAKLEKVGNVMRQLEKDIEAFEVTSAYAYNSTFDEQVFAFNCEWFKVINPLEVIPVYDIRGNAHNRICNTPEYKAFCERYELFTDSGNYSTTAESVYKYLLGTNDFSESHTALADVDIETEILFECFSLGDSPNVGYTPQKSIERTTKQELIILMDGDEVFRIDYTKRTNRKNKIFLKN